MPSALTIYEPQSLDQALQLSEKLARSALVPAALRGKPADVFIVLATGSELGLGPMQSLRGLHVIDGKVGMAADMMVALCVSKPQCEYFTLVESTDEKATYVAKRRGEGTKEQTLTFTMAMAKAAKLTGKQNWQNFPAAMLRARCASALAKVVFPDLLAGIYDPEELKAIPRTEEPYNATTGELQVVLDEPPKPPDPPIPPDTLFRPDEIDDDPIAGNLRKAITEAKTWEDLQAIAEQIKELHPDDRLELKTPWAIKASKIKPGWNLKPPLPQP